ncbi:hypothetical protein J3A84_11285 [Proteiniclasticum sp. SCR006]|uniref:Uncharacterized protein n=1 Tax=Proteiniclasticum aestuarii TaxID=2817862 RepID=A0A939KJX0_9CLOT|nr:hypothetical protein [Proteiniclasticum aestuarii]MBO1265618.1 hypothetical protein [Proteiniclasticum aestuarii]
MKYYLVALLDKESGKVIESSTRNLIKKIKPKKKTSFYGVVLETIEDPDLTKLEDIITDISRPIRYFKIDVQGNLSFDESTRTIGLDVSNFGYVKSLSRNFNTMLGLHGFKVREEEEIESKDSVQLVLFNGGITKDLASFQNVLRKNAGSKFRVDRFQLWKNFNFRKDSVVATIPLKDPNVISK